VEAEGEGGDEGGGEEVEGGEGAVFPCSVCHLSNF
jgi:hypothetical protein